MARESVGSDKGWGRVITIGSSGIEVPIPNLALSNGVRGAMAGWSKTLAGEVAHKGITVNIVLPGRIATDRVAELDAGKAAKSGESVEAVRDASRKTIPAGRYGRPEEFAAIVAFLASEQASFINGSQSGVVISVTSTSPLSNTRSSAGMASRRSPAAMRTRRARFLRMTSS